MTFVKVCGITTAEDAHAAVAAGADALGFNFYPKSPRYLTPAAAAAITREIAPHVLKVGVFVNEAPEAVAAIVAEAGLDVAQLHGDEAPPAIPPGIRVWKAYRVARDFDPAAMTRFPAEAYLLDAPTDLYGGAGEPFDWELARGAAGRFLLAGGLDETNVGEAIAAVHPWGVDSCSRLETAPGRKDHGRVARFIAAAKRV